MEQNLFKFDMDKANNGLPNHLFRYISSITPLINVDLIVCDPKKGFLLSWRSDEYYGPGWHIPGGIIRFKENLIDRLNFVAKNELNLDNELKYSLISINQIMNPTRDVRGHFISMLFISYIKDISINNKDIKERENGYLKWHKIIPDGIIKQHKRYEKILYSIMNNNISNSIDTGNLLENYSPHYEK